MSSLRFAGVALVLTCLAAGFPSQAQVSDTQQPRRACFFSNQFESWRAPDDKTIFIRVGLSRFYRLDLAAPCAGVTWPSAFLVNRIQGSNMICKALDWNITVSDSSTGGFGTACIVKSMTPLTPEEVASIPARFKP